MRSLSPVTVQHIPVGVAIGPGIGTCGFALWGAWVITQGDYVADSHAATAKFAVRNKVRMGSLTGIETAVAESVMRMRNECRQGSNPPFSLFLV